ncbi:hypothetical protein Ciccas_008529 [Cichlidogyrus casuarinus]|uniref:Uncharacterized protein n=1 Tax=Cichlidogyrus casuarinus TaxID=1844966 RepID=A0ABD2Q0I8_9PLAT
MSTQKFCYELSILTKSNTRPPHFRFSSDFQEEIRQFNWAKLNYYPDDVLLANLEEFLQIRPVLKRRDPGLLEKFFNSLTLGDGPKTRKRNVSARISAELAFNFKKRDSVTSSSFHRFNREKESATIVINTLYEYAKTRSRQNLYAHLFLFIL